MLPTPFISHPSNVLPSFVGVFIVAVSPSVFTIVVSPAYSPPFAFISNVYSGFGFTFFSSCVRLFPALSIAVISKSYVIFDSNAPNVYVLSCKFIAHFQNPIFNTYSYSFIPLFPYSLVASASSVVAFT